MADVFLQNRECNKGGTPKVCCVCGKRNAAPMPMKFKVRLYSVGNTTVYRVRDGWLPFCTEDKAKTQRKGWMMLGMFGVTFLTFVLVIAGSALAGAAGLLQRTGPLFPILGFGLCFITLIGTIIMAIVMNWGMVRATEINERGVRVTNVNNKFVVAVEEARGGGRDDDDEDDEDDRPRSKKRRDDDDDDDEDDEDDRPRKKKKRRYFDD